MSILKGLGCPAGTVLAGSEPFIQRAIRCRKALGGAMRQSGVLAAAGLWALNNNVQRLADDHKHTEMIAKGNNLFIRLMSELSLFLFYSDRSKKKRMDQS